MSAFQWWRSWHGAPTDHKWAVIAARSGVKVGIVSAVAWAMMDYASQHKERGTVDGFDIEEYAVYSGFTEMEVSAVINAMNDKGIIKAGRLVNWEKRQPQRNDDSTERVREWRAMKRNVTQGNTNETNVIPRVDKDKDKDTDTDKEREEEREESTPFTTIRDLIATITGMPPNASAIPAIDELVSMQATKEDIQAGYGWLCEQHKQFRYYGQLVGPTRTAMSKRLQAVNGKGIPADADALKARLKADAERYGY
jgi:hypothetical protein